MANDKKIENELKTAKRCLVWIAETAPNINSEINPKKKAKTQKQIELYKTYIVMCAKKITKLGGTINTLINEATPYQLEILNEIFPQGLDEKNIESQRDRNNVINDWKRRLNSLEKIKSKTEPYDDSLLPTEKKKNKIFSKEEWIGWILVSESDSSNQNNYNDVWNYARDLDSSPEFSEEEKNILRHCVAVREEYNTYVNEKTGRICSALEQEERFMKIMRSEKNIEKARKMATSAYEVHLEAIKAVSETDLLINEEIEKEVKRRVRDFYILAADDDRRNALIRDCERVMKENYQPEKDELGLAGKLLMRGKLGRNMRIMYLIEELGDERGANAGMIMEDLANKIDFELYKRFLKGYTFEELDIGE